MKYTNTVYPHNFDPARLTSIRLLHSLNRSMLVAIFPQKARTTVCLGFFINPSSMQRRIGNCFTAKTRPATTKTKHEVENDDSAILHFLGSL